MANGFVGSCGGAAGLMDRPGKSWDPGRFQ